MLIALQSPRGCSTHHAMTHGLASPGRKRSSATRPARRAARDRFDIHRAIALLRAAAPNWNAPVVTLIAGQSGDPFQILISCLLSLRTRDDTTGPAARRLFQLADTPAAMLELAPQDIERAIYPVGFYRTKARTIREICRDLIQRFAAGEIAVLHPTAR